MSIASNLAGKAINISKTTAPHATSYPFTSLFNISHGHSVGLFFEKFFQFNYINIKNAKTNFDLNERFKVNNLEAFTTRISIIKKQAGLEDNLTKLNIDIQKNSEKIIGGINLLRLGNNPVKISGEDIYKIITKK